MLHGDREVWQAEIDGADGEGVEPQVTLDLQRGDRVRFLIHKRGNIFCDTTQWDPVIRFEDGTTYQASSAFSANQGEGGWFYEMLDANPGPAAPLRMYGWSKDLAQCDFAIGEREVVLSAGDYLPLLVIADPLTNSGIAIAVDSRERWNCTASLSRDGQLHVAIRTPAAVSASTENRSPAVPTAAPVVIGAFEGSWTAAIPLLRRTLDDGQVPQAAATVQQAYNELARVTRNIPELELFLMVQGEWKLDDRIEETAESYAAATSQHLERIRSLLQDPHALVAERTEFQQAVDKLVAEGGLADKTLPALRRHYVRARLLKRSLLLSNPLIDFQRLLFCKRKPPSYSHLVGQYYGWRQRSGGGLFVLEDFGRSLRCRDVMQQTLPPGNILEPRLSYDGQRIVFSFVACSPTGLKPDGLVRNEDGPDEAYFHIYEVNADGTGVRQLTSGLYDDLMADYLPDGGIVFCSTRRQSYSRCFGPQFQSALGRLHALSNERGRE